LKVFRREALGSLFPETEGFFVNTEMLARARQLGYPVAEVGVRHRPRVRGTSKVSLRDIPRTLATLLPFWWTEVVFAGKGEQRQSKIEDGRSRIEEEPHLSRSSIFDPRSSITDAGYFSAASRIIAFLLLLLAAGLLFFGRLRSPLLEPEEAVYAEVPREMTAAGNWVLPLRQGRAYYEKPPLLYWLIMGSYASFGVHDWAARLIPCATGLGMILVTFWWGSRTFGFRAGLAGALILCLSPRFVHQARMITMDGLLCFWVISGLALGQKAIQAPLGTSPGGRLGWRWWLLSAAACGLGILTKGPLALALVAVPLMAYQLLDPRTARPNGRCWLAYLGTAVGLAMPWYATLAWRDPAFLREFFWTHHVVMRFVQPLHEEPVWFYLPVLLLGMLPWTLLLPGVIKSLIRRSDPHSPLSPRRRGDGGEGARVATIPTPHPNPLPQGERANRPAGLGFLLLCCLWCLIFFSAAGCKRIGYILPAMPPLALILGHTLARRLPGQGLTPKQSRIEEDPPPSRSSIFYPRSSMLPWAACGLSTFAILFLAVHCLLPGYYRKFSLRTQVRSLLDASYHRQAPVICYPHIWDSVCFYLGRDDVRAFSAERRADLIAELCARPKTLVVVKSDHWLNDLRRALPPELEFLPRGRQGNVTAGVVQRRQSAPEIIVAKR
jgi:4-amino-4-deoxy-L-arabinose transferase-like glycosyltransferase